jgi:hypothetical protein
MPSKPISGNAHHVITLTNKSLITWMAVLARESTRESKKNSMLVKDHVDFECRVCHMTIKKGEDIVEDTGPRADTIYYSHAKHRKEEGTLVGE